MNKRVFYNDPKKNGDRHSYIYSTKDGRKYKTVVNFILGYCKLLNGKSRLTIKVHYSKNEKVLLRKARGFLFEFGVVFDSNKRPDKVESCRELYKRGRDERSE